MTHKLLIIIVLIIPILAQAQDAAPAPAVAPLQLTLNNAREAARNDDADTAVAELQKLADAGFTSVAIITSDQDLSALAGHAGYDKLVADMSVLAYPCEHDVPQVW